jgi:hypothetical protein
MLGSKFTRKRVAVLILGTVLVLGASAAISWGGGSSNPKLPTKPQSFTYRAGHEVQTPSKRTAARGTTTGIKLRYFETNEFPISPNGRDDSFMRCPRRFVAINGYFGTDEFIFPDYLASGNSLRVWDYGLQDTSGLRGHAFEGIVCLKGVPAS